MTDETPTNEKQAVEAEAEEKTNAEDADAPVAEATDEAPEATEEEAEAPVAEANADVEAAADTEEAAEASEAADDAEETEADTEADAAEDAEEETVDGPGSLEELEVGMELRGKVKSLELYGAFVDIGVGKDALLHISQLGKRNIRNVEDVVKAGEMITVYVIKVDPGSGRIALSSEKPPENPISDLKVGAVVTGRVVRIENFGAFVDFGAERPGMVHVSELSTDYINSPEDVVSLNDEVKVKVIKINKKRRQIDLSIKALEEAEQRRVIEEASVTESDEPMPTAMELALRRAMSSDSDDAEEEEAPTAETTTTNTKKNRNSRKKKKAHNDALQRMLDSDS